MQDTSRESANELMHLNGYVDVLIPRGGAGLIRAVAQEAKVPVIRTGEGVPHLCGILDAKPRHGGGDFVQRENARRPSVCATRWNVLIHEAVAAEFCRRPCICWTGKMWSCGALQRRSRCLARGPGRRRTPTGTRNMTITSAVRVVRDLDEAMEFIAAHSTQHLLSAS